VRSENPKHRGRIKAKEGLRVIKQKTKLDYDISDGYPSNCSCCGPLPPYLPMAIPLIYIKKYFN